MYSLYGHPKYFNFKQKYQQIRPVFSDHLSVSHDYRARNLDEYFHFYSIDSEKFKMKEIFEKKVEVTACHNCYCMLRS